MVTPFFCIFISKTIIKNFFYQFLSKKVYGSELQR